VPEDCALAKDVGVGLSLLLIAMAIPMNMSTSRTIAPAPRPRTSGARFGLSRRFLFGRREELRRLSGRGSSSRSRSLGGSGGCGRGSAASARRARPAELAAGVAAIRSSRGRGAAAWRCGQVSAACRCGLGVAGMGIAVLHSLQTIALT
jgi:hypothetical protein